MKMKKKTRFEMRNLFKTKQKIKKKSTKNNLFGTTLPFN